MAYAGRVRLKGSIRVTVAAATSIVAGSNSGLFLEPAVDNGVGDTTLNIDPDNPNSLAAQDTVLVQVEGTLAVIALAQRVSATALRVRTFTELGAAVDAPFALVVHGVFQG